MLAFGDPPDLVGDLTLWVCPVQVHGAGHWLGLGPGETGGLAGECAALPLLLALPKVLIHRHKGARACRW